MVTVKEIQEREKELKGIKEEQQAVTREKIPVRRFGRSVQRTIARQQAILQRRQQATANIQRISQEQKELTAVKQQVRSFEAQKESVASFNRDLKQARKFAGAGGRGALLVTRESKRIQELFKEIREGRRVVQPRAPSSVSIPEGFVGVTTPRGEGVVAIGTEEIFFPESLPGRTVGVSTPEGAGVVIDRDIFVSRQSIEPITLAKFEFGGRPSGQPETTQFERLPPPRQELKGVEKFEAFIQERRESFKDFKDLPLLSFQAGVAAGIIIKGTETFTFGKQLVSEPKATSKAAIAGVTGIIKDPGAFIGREIAFAKADPGQATGKLIGEAFLLKGSGKLLRVGETGLEFTRAVISPKFKRLKVRDLPKFKTTERFIDLGPEIKDIVLIPAGLERRTKGTLRPSVRGGFGFTRKEQLKFLKEEGSFVSSQADFNLDLLDKPLKKELFATPPIEEAGFARVSRLGLGQREANLKDILNLDFTFKKTRPKIFIFPKEKFRKGGFTPQLSGSELEAILKPGLDIKITGKPVVTFLEGRKIDLLTLEIGKKPKRGIVPDLSLKDINKILGTNGKRTSRGVPTPRISPTRSGIQSLISLTRASRPTKSTRLFTQTSKITGLTSRRPFSKRISSPILKPSKALFKTPSTKLPRTPSIKIPTTTTITPRITKIPTGPPPTRITGRTPIVSFAKTPLLGAEFKVKPRKKKRKRKGREDLFIAEGFTARALKLPPIKIPRSKLREAALRTPTLGIRRRPIIINSPTRKRRKKRR